MTVDIVEKARSRILSQDYCVESNTEILLAFPKVARELEIACHDVQNILSIKESKNLDLIGRIVNVRRPEVVIPLHVNSIGTKTAYCGGRKAYCQGPVYATEAGLSDHIYRMMIVCKILTNNTDCTIDDVKAVLVAFLSTSDVIVEDNEDMSFRIIFVGMLTETERYIIDEYKIIPTPQGVRMTDYVETALKLRLGKSFAVLGNRKAHL